MLFPTPVLRPMTAATVGIVSAPPVMNRNSATTAVPARIFPIRKNPATAMKAHIVINTEKRCWHIKRVSIFFTFSRMPRHSCCEMRVISHLIYYSQTTFRSFGNAIVISVPFPTSLTIFNVPPRKVTPCLTMDNPRPVPPIALE